MVGRWCAWTTFHHHSHWYQWVFLLLILLSCPALQLQAHLGNTSFSSLQREEIKLNIADLQSWEDGDKVGTEVGAEVVP